MTPPADTVSPPVDATTAASASPSGSLRLGRRRAALVAGMAAVVALAVAFALRMDAFGAGFSGADEPSHYLNAYLVWSWLTEGFGTNPIAFAKELYVHYPKLSIGHWPPLYYGVTGPLLFALPHDPAIAFGLNLAVTVLPALMVMALLAPRIGTGWALLAGAWLVSVPLTIESASFLMLDQAVAALALAGAVVWNRYAAAPTLRDALLYGLIAGAAILVKGNGWLLGLVPVIHMALSGQVRLAINWRTWAGGAVALALAAPWTAISFAITSDGFNYAWGLDYTLTALRVFGGSLAFDHVGVAGVILAVAGLATALRALRNDPLRPLALACLSLILATVLFHAIVPVDLAARYMAAAVPPLVLLGAVGGWALVGRLGVPPRRRGILAVTLLAILMLPGLTFLWAQDGKVDLRMDVAAAAVTGTAPTVVVVDGSSGAEGALAAETAIRDPARQVWVVRSSDLLAASDFMGNSYALRHETAAEVLAALSDLGAGMIVIAQGEGVQPYPHNAQLLAALQAADSPYQLERRLPHRNRTGETRIYRHMDPPPVDAARVRALNMPEKAPTF